MISLDTLLSLLTLNSGIDLNDFLATLLSAPQLVIFFERSPALKKMLQSQLPRIKDDISQQLKITPVPDNLAVEFQLYMQNQTVTLSAFNHQLRQLVQQLVDLNSPFLPGAQSLIDQLEQPLFTNAQYNLFMQRWRVSLTLQALTLNEDLLEQQRDDLIKKLTQQLSLTGALAPLFGDEDLSNGRLWDLSRASLQGSDSQLLNEYSQFLRGQPEVTELVEKLGRSRESDAAPDVSKQQAQISLSVRQPHTQPEEVNGIYQSNDILRLLPPELAVMGVNELEIEFYRRLIEKRLLTYQLKGEDYQPLLQTQSVAYQQQQKTQPKGPFILCVDTSGSMGGFNERCAKAFCLALLKIALQEQRRCFVMLFTREIIRYELTADTGISQLIRFLSQRFRGGTDLAGCLTAALDKLESTQWQEADVVVISDFVAQRLPELVIDRVQRQQSARQQQFHAVSLSDYGKPRLMAIFNFVWHFDTKLKSRLLRRFRR